MALATHDGPQAHAQTREPARRRGGEDRGVEASGGEDAQACPEPTAQAPMALHPPLRRRVERSESAVLRRPADGSQLPAQVRRRTALTQRDGESLDAPRADVGGRAGAPCRPGVLSLAEHGALLRFDLVVWPVTLPGSSVASTKPGARRMLPVRPLPQTLNVVVRVDLLDLPVAGRGIFGGEQLDEQGAVVA